MTSTASAKKDSAGGLFARYVSQNILGMLGLSAYVLADTFFISLAQGADGITALNLILPLYSLIFAIGSMIGVVPPPVLKFIAPEEIRKRITIFPTPSFLP